MTELHQTLHENSGICLWTLLAMIAFAVLLVIFIIHSIGQGSRRAYNNKKIRDYNKEMSAMGMAAISEAETHKQFIEEDNPEPVIPNDPEPIFTDEPEPVEQEIEKTKLFDGKY